MHARLLSIMATNCDASPRTSWNIVQDMHPDTNPLIMYVPDQTQYATPKPETKAKRRLTGTLRICAPPAAGVPGAAPVDRHRRLGAAVLHRLGQGVGAGIQRDADRAADQQRVLRSSRRR